MLLNRPSINRSKELLSKINELLKKFSRELQRPPLRVIWGNLSLPRSPEKFNFMQ